jgi:hypothetical protein
VPIHGVGVDTSGRTYSGRINFATPSRVFGVNHFISIDTQVSSGDLQSEKLDGLIGRDVLQYFEFGYNGHTGKFSLKYLGNKIIFN